MIALFGKNVKAKTQQTPIISVSNLLDTNFLLFSLFKGKTPHKKTSGKNHDKSSYNQIN